MTRYILKDGELDGIYPGIGNVTAGQPIEVFTPEQEELLKKDSRFKQYREPAPAAEAVTEGGTVKDKPAPRAAKE